MNPVKRITAAALSLSLICGLPLPVYAEDTFNQEFDDFMRNEFVDTMESDFMTMHFTIRDYASYGIEKPEANIGSASWDDYAEAVEEGKEVLAELEAFDYESLSDTQKHDYDAMYFYLERYIEEYSCPDYDWMFMPSEGLIDNLPTNFTEYVFYEKQDIDDYLDVLASVSDYIDGALEITEIQVSHGVFMTDSALDSTLDAINKFVERTDDNPLIVIFEENIDAFEGLTDQERADYKQRNRDILFNSYVPAYRRAYEKLESFRGTRDSSVPICDLPGGQEYYNSHLKSKSSSDMSPQEMLDLCTAFIEQEISDYIDIIYAVSNQSVLDETIKLSEPEEIIKWHEEKMNEYPEGPKVTYKAAYLDPAVASDGIMAYYLEPPMDQITDNVIKINGDNVGDINELYSTLAHEGFPGHLYQITWYLNTNPNPARSILSFIGYSEGWAMYVEDTAWEWSGLNIYAQEFDRINTSMGYAMNAAADIGVNGLGWSEKELGDYLNDLGLNSEIASDLYDFVMDTPGVIVPYGVGLVQFMTIRDEAEKALQSQFDAVEFNRVLLTDGDRPFELVRKDVQKWIDSFDPSQREEIIVPDTIPKRSVNPLIYIGGFAVAAIGIIVGIILIRRSRRSDPFA